MNTRAATWMPMKNQNTSKEKWRKKMSLEEKKLNPMIKQWLSILICCNHDNRRIHSVATVPRKIKDIFIFTAAQNEWCAVRSTGVLRWRCFDTESFLKWVFGSICSVAPLVLVFSDTVKWLHVHHVVRRPCLVQPKCLSHTFMDKLNEIQGHSLLCYITDAVTITTIRLFWILWEVWRYAPGLDCCQ